MKIKARVMEVSHQEDFEVTIYVSGRWRAFATPYSLANQNVTLFKHQKTAKRAAEKVAGALDITLEWEDAK